MRRVPTFATECTARANDGGRGARRDRRRVRSTLYVGRLARRDDRPRIGASHARVHRSEVITPDGGSTNPFAHPSDQRIGLPEPHRGGEGLLRGSVSPSRAAVAWALGTGPE